MTDITDVLVHAKFATLANLRELTLPDFATIEEYDPMALVLVVNTDLKDAAEAPSEQDVLIAAIHAVDLALTDEREDVQVAIEQWCSGRIRKLVKRAKASAWSKLADNPDYIETAHYNNAQVAVFKPRPVSEMSPELRKLQVQGLQFTPAADEFEIEGPHLEVQLDAALEMSTGKAAAQVGHAVQLFLMHAKQDAIIAWWASGRATQIRYVNEVHAAHEIRDAGFTEVAANSLTAGSTFHG